jgi:hypothetical protein
MTKQMHKTSKNKGSSILRQNINTKEHQPTTEDRLKIKVKLSLSLTNQALRHENVWGK